MNALSHVPLPGRSVELVRRWVGSIEPFAFFGLKVLQELIAPQSQQSMQPQMSTINGRQGASVYTGGISATSVHWGN